MVCDFVALNIAHFTGVFKAKIMVRLLSLCVYTHRWFQLLHELALISHAPLQDPEQPAASAAAAARGRDNLAKRPERTRARLVLRTSSTCELMAGSGEREICLFFYHYFFMCDFFSFAVPAHTMLMRVMPVTARNGP